MSILLTSLSDKAEAIDLFEAVLKKFVLPHVDRHGIEAINEQLAWMRSQRGDMRSFCKLATDPLDNSTHLSIVLSFPMEVPLANPHH